MRRLIIPIQRLRHSIARLGRGSLRGRAAVALLALLSLGLLEPLACILHCDVFLPMVAAQQHVHHQRGITFHAAVDDASALCMFGMTQAEMSMHTADPTPSKPLLLRARLLDSTSSAPVSVAPLPFHEMALTFVVLLCTAPLLLRARARPPQAIPRRTDPPPLRPPVGFLQTA